MSIDVYDNIFIKPYVILKKVCLLSVWIDVWFYVILKKMNVQDLSQKSHRRNMSKYMNTYIFKILCVHSNCIVCCFL